jgi:hypothetical protein
VKRFVTEPTPVKIVSKSTIGVENLSKTSLFSLGLQEKNNTMHKSMGNKYK